MCIGSQNTQELDATYTGLVTSSIMRDPNNRNGHAWHKIQMHVTYVKAHKTKDMQIEQLNLNGKVSHQTNEITER